MTFSISAPRPITAPVRKAAFGGQKSAATPLLQAMAALPIGEGFDYVVAGKNREGQPQKADLKNQYAHTAAAIWYKGDEPKTFKVFESEDQSDLGEFETRFTVVRVEPVAPRAPKKKADAAATAAETEGSASGDASGEDGQY